MSLSSRWSLFSRGDTNVVEEEFSVKKEEEEVAAVLQEAHLN